MALTPEDVVNKRFQPTKFREGYDQDEVDDFLDEVVVELRRLSQENEELRQRVAAKETSAAQPQQSAAQNVGAERVAPRFGETPVAAVVPSPVPYTASEQDDIDTGSTNNLLQLARKLHEEHVREGIQKRDALIAEGHATAARVVTEAESAQRAEISALHEEKAVLEGQKSSINAQIEQLRTFEREYRHTLKAYIEGQLKELDASQPAAEVPEPVSTVSIPGFGGN